MEIAGSASSACAKTRVVQTEYDPTQKDLSERSSRQLVNLLLDHAILANDACCRIRSGAHQSVWPRSTLKDQDEIRKIHEADNESVQAVISLDDSHDGRDPSSFSHSDVLDALVEGHA